jgi:signal transduction histidine kinase
MRATEAHFRGLADPLAQLVWVVDGAGRLVYGLIGISVGTESDWALVRARDTGVGIAGDMLTRVFDPYVQAERGSEAGLGLGLARHLVKLHGGEVDAYSEGPGRGSEFVVRLPCLGCSVDSRGPLALTDAPSVPK